MKEGERINESPGLMEDLGDALEHALVLWKITLVLPINVRMYLVRNVLLLKCDHQLWV